MAVLANRFVIMGPVPFANLSGEYREETHASRARAIGRDSGDNRILEEALDWDLLAMAIDQLEQDYDPNLQTAVRAQERVDAILRQMSLRAERGNLIIPTDIGQELLDVVEVTDERCGIDQEKYRSRPSRLTTTAAKASMSSG